MSRKLGTFLNFVKKKIAAIDFKNKFSTYYYFIFKIYVYCYTKIFKEFKFRNLIIKCLIFIVEE